MSKSSFFSQNGYFEAQIESKVINWLFLPPKWLKIFLKLFSSSRQRKTVSVTWQTPLLHLIIEYLKKLSLIAPCNQPTAHPPKISQISIDIHTFRTEIKLGLFQFGLTYFKMIYSQYNFAFNYPS